MTAWMRCNLGDADLAGEALEQVRTLVEGGSSGRPGAPAAAFFRHESEGRLHCEIWIYFTPAATAAARAAGAAPCPKPAPDGLSLLAGPPDAWALLD